MTCALLLALALVQASSGQAGGRISQPPQNSAMRSGWTSVPQQISGSTPAQGGSSPSASSDRGGNSTNQMTLTSGGAGSTMQADGAGMGTGAGGQMAGGQTSGAQGSAASSGSGSASGAMRQPGQRGTSYDNVGIRQEGSQQDR